VNGESVELLDIKQAAAFLRVSETSLRRWTNSGRLKCFRVGLRRERRFRRADLLEFMEQPGGAASGGTSIGGVAVAHGSHYCSLYESELARTRQAVAFLADGLGPESVCYLASLPEARAPVLALLEQDRPSLRSDIAAGRLVFAEYVAAADEQCAIWEATFIAASRSAARSFRVVGDVSGGRLARENQMGDVLDYERNYERLIAQRFPVVTLCQYDARRLTGTDVAGLLGCHTDDFGYPAQRLIG